MRNLSAERVLVKKRGRSALGLLLLVSSFPALCHGFSAPFPGTNSPFARTSSTTASGTAVSHHHAAVPGKDAFRTSSCRRTAAAGAASVVRLGMSSRSDEPTTIAESSSKDSQEQQQQQPKDEEESNENGMLQEMSKRFEQLNLENPYKAKRPPAQVDDTPLLFYDVFLILNLVVSISFWVTHRMDFTYIAPALSEACLVSLLWIASGLYTGAFLYSAVDGHYGSSDERGGPKAAGLLGFHTFLNAVNLRLLVALLMAVAQHRPVGSGMGEDLLPLEIGFGFMLMSGWRTLHSSNVPRL
jgi:hypothetical protein